MTTIYIDEYLRRTFEERYRDKNLDIQDAIEQCGVWYSIDGIRAEEEDFSLTLQEIITDYYFIVEGNTIKFCSPDMFIEDCDELCR